jgi:hypothetical protein
VTSLNKVKSDFALLDVKKGRRALRKRLEQNPTRIPVTIHGFIATAWSDDDGTSIEFEVEVTSVKEGHVP